MVPTGSTHPSPPQSTQGPQLLLEQALSWSVNTVGGCGFRINSGLLGMKTSALSFRLADKTLSILLPVGKQWILSAPECRENRAFLSDICLSFHPTNFYLPNKYLLTSSVPGTLLVGD